MKEFVEGLKKHLEAKYSWLGDVSYLLADIDSFAEAFEKKYDRIPVTDGIPPEEQDILVDIWFDDGMYQSGVWAYDYYWDHATYYRIHKED